MNPADRRRVRELDTRLRPLGWHVWAAEHMFLAVTRFGSAADVLGSERPCSETLMADSFPELLEKISSHRPYLREGGLFWC